MANFKKADSSVPLLNQSEKDKLQKKSEIEKRLQKIVHRTWYIFDPSKKKKLSEQAEMVKVKRKITQVSNN